MVLFCDYHSPEANLRGRGAPLGGVLFLLGIPTYKLVWICLCSAPPLYIGKPWTINACKVLQGCLYVVNDTYIIYTHEEDTIGFINTMFSFNWH